MIAGLDLFSKAWLRLSPPSRADAAVVAVSVILALILLALDWMR